MSIRAILVTLPVKIQDDFKNEIYKDFIATTLQFVNENIVEQFGGSKTKYSYFDLINGNVEKEDERSGDEIVDDVLGMICRKES